MLLRTLVLVVTLSGLVPASASAQETPDPQVIFDLYLTYVERGDYEGAFSWCAIPGEADPDAVGRLRSVMGQIATEVDLMGVMKALSLFVPLSPSPVEWRLRAAPPPTATEARLDFTASTTLTYDHTVYFVKSGPQWRIDLQRTFLENARGTRVERILADRGSVQAAVSQLTAVARAMARYVEDHDGRLPQAETWQEDLLAYSDLLSPADLVSPGEVSGQRTYAINENLAGQLGRDIANPCLLYTSPSPRDS